MVGRTAILVTSVVAVAFAAGSTHAQLLYDDTPHYERNYAEVGYWPYTADIWSQTRRPVYDDLGNFIMRGSQVWTTEETRPVDSDAYGSVVSKDNVYAQWLNHLVIAKDTYRNWASRLIVGDRIRTKFTPLTLDLAALNGVRWDVDMGATEMSLVSSRYDWPIYASGIRSGSGSSAVDNEFHSERQRATYLIGGHLERQIGALNVGLSYVNLNRTDTFLDWGDNSLKGILPEAVTPTPHYIAVRVQDGSQDNAGGARVYDMQVLGPLADQVQVTVTRHNARKVDLRYPNGDEYFRPGHEIPPFVEFLRGSLPPAAKGYDEAYRADGYEYVIFWFKLPGEEEVDQRERLRFRALVAGDYDISVSEVFPSQLGLNGYRSTYFYPVAAQKGNVQDAANLRWVEFEYGRQSGRTTASLRAELETAGLEVRTEYARTYDFRQFPSEHGLDRWSTTAADAYFVNVKKHFDGWALGAEYFRVDPRYRTSIFVQNSEYRTYSDILGSPFPEVYPDWGKRYNYTLELDSVDDNDDKDLWPDFHHLPQSFGDVDGVFPGLDRDQNGLTDTNENGNNEPDYLEPFFLYKVDPPEYDFGDDLNNNGVIDHREDDSDPDYPYDMDTRGLHLFSEISPTRHLTFTLGHFNVREIWGAGRNRMSYIKAGYERALYPYGRIDFRSVLKRVRDDIADDTSQFAYFEQHAIPFDPTSDAPANYTAEVQDPLLFRDSYAGTAYLDATLMRIENLNVNGRTRVSLNRQAASGLQASNSIREWAWVLRTDYDWHIRNFRVTPKIKYMAYRKKDDEGRVNQISERFLYPMLVVDYPLTTRTSVRAGAQGMPLLRAKYRNVLNPDVDYESEDYILMLTNRTTYEGYIMMLNMGYHLKKLEFENRKRAVQDIDRALFFLRLVMGVEPFQG